FAVDPKRFVEPHGVDNERLALPVADGMTVIARAEIFRVLLCVHRNFTPGVRTTDIENVHPLQLRDLYKLDSIRRDQLTGSTGRFATSVRLQSIVQTIIQQCPGPWLEWHLAVFRVRITQRVGTRAWAAANSHIRHCQPRVYGKPETCLSFDGSE